MVQMGSIRRDLIEAGHRASKTGLVTSSSGNISARGYGDRFYVSPSGACLGNLQESDIAVVQLSDGAHLAGPPPSMETPIHRSAYLVRPEVNAVLHCQSPAATGLACMVDPPTNLNLIPEVPAYCGKHVYVDFALPGSEALAAAVTQALADSEVAVVQLINHGQLIVGASADDVVRAAAFFELAAWIATQPAALRTIAAPLAATLQGYGAQLRMSTSCTKTSGRPDDGGDTKGG
jgi:ribulose-5-phosphate 4-epimerase/fuculose-1-phosphate aldolase